MEKPFGHLAQGTGKWSLGSGWSSSLSIEFLLLWTNRIWLINRGQCNIPNRTSHRVLTAAALGRLDDVTEMWDDSLGQAWRTIDELTSHASTPGGTGWSFVPSTKDTWKCLILCWILVPAFTSHTRENSLILDINRIAQTKGWQASCLDTQLLDMSLIQEKNSCSNSQVWVQLLLPMTFSSLQDDFCGLLLVAAFDNWPEQPHTCV